MKTLEDLTDDIVTDYSLNPKATVRRTSFLRTSGHRVELGEIEFTLGKHPDIPQTAVLLVSDHEDESSLVAFYSLSVDAKLSTQELRVFCQKCLPNYMIPSLFVSLQQFPLTANGKIDLKGTKSRPRL